ncbi:signal peptidase I [Clostridia bacterium]|nr:signal peptidase I [Clostridia bacterium]
MNRKTWRSVFDWTESGIAAVAAVVVLFAFVARVTRVDGESMMPTLHNDERLLIYDLLYTPARNDIVVLQAKGDWQTIDDPEAGYPNGKPIVKRIIAVSGDKVDIDFDKGIVYVNGNELPQSEIDGNLAEDGHYVGGYTTDPERLIKNPLTGMMISPEAGIAFNANGQPVNILTGKRVRDNDVPYGLTVPEGQVFVMGDNRGHSTDGRALGCIDNRYLVGKVFFRITGTVGTVV